MLKQSIIYLLISIMIVLFASQIQVVLVYINVIFTNMNIRLAPIFSPTETGIVFRKTFALLILPLIITGLPALAYKFIKGNTLPYLIEITWFVWLILVLSTILIN